MCKLCSLNNLPEKRRYKTESTTRDCGRWKFFKAATFSVHMVHVTFGLLRATWTE
ncbi:hypothetical protein DM41_7016 [Burkholderia cepacia ATCC 25416]|nr:hypothetical protein DM41_7016 [Burkholderia cepacia ATCC 25416]